MVLKEGKVLAIGVLMALFLLIGNSTYILVKTEDSVGMISGNSIKDVVSGFYETSSVNHRIFILFQFFLLILIIVVILIIVKKFKKKVILSKGDFVTKVRGGSKTDLDILYEMLKHEKHISIDDIGKVFKVSPSVSLEWSKVLEDGDLAIIDYPRFGKPVLRLIGDEEEKEGEESELQVVKKGEEKKVEGKVPLATKENVEMKGSAVKKVIPVKKMSKRATKKKIKKIDKKIKIVSKKIKKGTQKVSKHSKKIEKIKKPKKK